MKIIAANEPRHSGAILKIFNDAILTSTALYDYQPRTPEIMKAWFETKRKGAFPVIVAENDSGQLLGFGAYGTFRPHPGYKYTVEHSVYVDANARGRGIGRALLQELINIAQKQNYHVLVGVIDTTNAASIRLHETAGFTRCGHIRDVGFKFGRWLDVAFYQLILPTPANPIDG